MMLKPSEQELILAITRVIPSTEVCAAIGDTPMFELLSRYYGLVSTEVEVANGRVIKVMGNTILMTFPAGNPGTAIAALRAAQTKANALWQQVDSRCRVQVKVGIGNVAVGTLGPPGRPDIVGNALNQLFKASWGDFEITAELARLLAP
jgi:class 3 adenylate cyclase